MYGSPAINKSDLRKMKWSLVNKIIKEIAADLKTSERLLEVHSDITTQFMTCSSIRGYCHDGVENILSILIR